MDNHPSNTKEIMNEFQQWWVTHLAQETEKAHKRAERLYPIRILSNKTKRDIFMDTFHWTMLEQRITMEKLFKQPVNL
jgi:hypothetical protein